VTPVIPVAPTPQKRRFGLAPLAAALAALLVVIAGSAWWFLSANRPESVATKAPAEAARLSIVVLPCANLSGDPSQDYLGDALTDELTTSLARIRGTFVIARNSAFAYKGKAIDAKAIGKDLGVRYVLNGSVQPSGAQIRVSAQLIDADSGAHLWADQFDTPRADLLQMQDEIVARLAYALGIELAYVEAARLRRTPAANANAEDLALQCGAGVRRGGLLGKEADASYRLCEQALAADPNNVRALEALAVKFWLPVAVGLSADPEADLKRGDELVSKSLALELNYPASHIGKSNVLLLQGRYDEAITENETALALNPAAVDALGDLGWDYLYLGQFEKSLEFFDRGIRLSPLDRGSIYWFGGKSWDHFGLKQYDQAIDWARRSIAIANGLPFVHAQLIAAFALTGHAAEAREVLERYVALPLTEPKTMVAWRAFYKARGINERSDPRILECDDRIFDGLRKAGMPEQ
jgi:TolB-like protein